MNSLVLSVLISACAFGDSPLATGEGSYCYEPAYKLDFKFAASSKRICHNPATSCCSPIVTFFGSLPTIWGWHFSRTAPVSCSASPTARSRFSRRWRTTPCTCAALKCYRTSASTNARAACGSASGKVPLTEDQSACLTAWAMRQEWKRFGLIRLGGQLTPLRSPRPVAHLVPWQAAGRARQLLLFGVGCGDAGPRRPDRRQDGPAGSDISA